MNPNKYELFCKRISQRIPGNRIFQDPLRLLAFGTDAGCYRLIPRLVIKTIQEEEVKYIIQWASKYSVPLTFRAAGTSLSGQSITDSVLVLAQGDGWNQIEPLEAGQKVKVQPGATGWQVNRILAKYKRKMGPDPASLNSAMIGGMVANNASGMSCGTHDNMYASLLSMRMILADGSILDTHDPVSRDNFRFSHPEILQFVISTRSKILSNKALCEKIQSKYSIKNTVGYGLNSFLDFEDPFDIIQHLMVGSEGTLGFISEVNLKTLPETKYKATGMIYFHSPADACQGIEQMKEQGAVALELIDRMGLKAVENQEGMPPFLKDLAPHVAALLVEIHAQDEVSLQHNIRAVVRIAENYRTVRPVELTTDPLQYLRLWNIRKGVFPAVGATRKPGTTVLIEDVAVSTNRMSEAIDDLRKLLDEFNFPEAVIYGHAIDGNVHFILTQDFSHKDEIERYRKLMDSVAKLIVGKYKGSLKAEHGTGRNMAPFVQYEWGEDAYQIMQEIKRTFDPGNILNPGVILNEDPEIHLKNFKPMPACDPMIDTCIECGFCEINCLTHGLSLSARQRIAVQREIVRLENTHTQKRVIKSWKKSYKGWAIDSCATDGLCSLSCPVKIDTGVYMKQLRESHHSKKSSRVLARLLSRQFNRVLVFVRIGLWFTHLIHQMIGTKAARRVFGAIHKISGKKIPLWTPFMPKPISLTHRLKILPDVQGPAVVYFPSCINRIMGPATGDPDKLPLAEVFVLLLHRAGYKVIFPPGMESLCCGTPWESKGFMSIANQKSDALEKALLTVSENGKYPVVCDTSPCIYRMKRVLDNRIKIYEPAEFILLFMKDRLTFRKAEEKICLHSTCTTTKMGLTEKLTELAKMCAQQVILPENTGCCGFAGDKGFSQPEINRYALRYLPEEIKGCSSGYSNSRTCEIGLSENTGLYYKSIVYLVEKATRN